MFYDFHTSEGYGGYNAKSESQINDIIQDIVDVMFADGCIKQDEEFDFDIVQLDDNQNEICHYTQSFSPSHNDAYFGKLPQSSFI